MKIGTALCVLVLAFAAVTATGLIVEAVQRYRSQPVTVEDMAHEFYRANPTICDPNFNPGPCKKVKTK